MVARRSCWVAGASKRGYYTELRVQVQSHTIDPSANRQEYKRFQSAFSHHHPFFIRVRQLPLRFVLTRPPNDAKADMFLRGTRLIFDGHTRLYAHNENHLVVLQAPTCELPLPPREHRHRYGRHAGKGCIGNKKTENPSQSWRGQPCASPNL